MIFCNQARDVRALSPVLLALSETSCAVLYLVPMFTQGIRMLPQEPLLFFECAYDALPFTRSPRDLPRVLGLVRARLHRQLEGAALLQARRAPARMDVYHEVYMALAGTTGDTPRRHGRIAAQSCRPPSRPNLARACRALQAQEHGGGEGHRLPAGARGDRLRREAQARGTVVRRVGSRSGLAADSRARAAAGRGGAAGGAGA